MSPPHLPALDSTPALFSRGVTTGELRDHLGFAGTAITDDLEVPRSAGVAPPASALSTPLPPQRHPALRPVTGCGLRGANALKRALGDGSLDRGEFATATRRVLDLRSRRL